MRIITRPAWRNDVRAFVMRGSVVDLAVALVIGAAFTGDVNRLVKDVFNPLLSLLPGSVNLSTVFAALNGQRYASLADAQQAGAPTLDLGLFINAIIQFLIMAFAVIWLVKALYPAVAARGRQALGFVLDGTSAGRDSRPAEAGEGVTDWRSIGCGAALAGIRW